MLGGALVAANDSSPDMRRRSGGGRLVAGGAAADDSLEARRNRVGGSPLDMERLSGVNVAAGTVSGLGVWTCEARAMLAVRSFRPLVDVTRSPLAGEGRRSCRSRHAGRGVLRDALCPVEAARVSGSDFLFCPWLSSTAYVLLSTLSCHALIVSWRFVGRPYDAVVLQVRELASFPLKTGGRML